MIPLTKPYISSNTKNILDSVLCSGVLTEGPITKKFEDAFAAFIGVSDAIATTSCTTGLELVLRALNIQPGDEIIVPNYTYPATAQAVMVLGATAVIIDSDPNTFNINYDAIEAAITKKTRVIIPVSLFGNPLDWDILNYISSKNKLFIVEDAACGFGSTYNGKYTGSFGHAAVFSLHPRKSITTGEGGMITTNNSSLADKIRSIKRFGLKITHTHTKDTLAFVYLGMNGKMSDILAAIGLAQMAEIEILLHRRTALGKRYQELLKDAEQKGHIYWPMTPTKGTYGWQSCCIRIKERDRILKGLYQEGIEAQIGTYILHHEPLFQNHPLCRIQGEMTGSIKAYEEALTLPLFHTLTETEQVYIVEKIYAQL